MKFICYTLVIDDCDLSAPELFDYIIARTEVGNLYQVIKVAPGYYEKQRIIRATHLGAIKECREVLGI